MKKMKVNYPLTYTYSPDIRLGPWIESYIILKHIKGGISEDIPWTIMPDCSGYLIFHLLGDYSTISFVGPRSVFKNINRRDRILTLIVKFNPGGMTPLFPFPVSVIKDDSISVQSILGKPVQFLKNQIDEQLRKGDVRQSLVLIEQFFLEKLLYNTQIHPIAEYATKRIRDNLGAIRVKEIAEEAGISTRYFRKVFSEDIGLSPKRYAMVTRVTNIVKKIDEGGTKDWIDLALSSNYFDQSHLIEDFNLLLGESPEVFINRNNREEIL